MPAKAAIIGSIIDGHTHMYFARASQGPIMKLQLRREWPGAGRPGDEKVDDDFH